MLPRESGRSSSGNARKQNTVTENIPNKYGTNQRFWTPPKFSLLWFEFWILRFIRLLSQRSTLQIVVLAFVLHSILSMLMLYIHLMYFSESFFSKHSSEHSHEDRGQLSMSARNPTMNDIDYEIRYRIKKIDLFNQTLIGMNKSVNLLNSKLLNPNEMTYIGWFNDHYRWNSRIQCFNNRWSLCDNVFTAKCKLETIRAIYQYVPFEYVHSSLYERQQNNDDDQDSGIFELFVSLRANAEDLIEQDTNVAFFGLLMLVSFRDRSQEIVRLGFQPEIDNWSVRSITYKSTKAIQSAVVMLTCLGYGGSVSFTDVRLSVPIVGFSDPVHSPEKLLSRCNKHNNEKSTIVKPIGPPLDSERRPLRHYEVLSFENETTPNFSEHKNSLTLVTQVSIDRLTILEYSLQTWIGGALSLVIHVPIGSEHDEIKDWQRMYVKKKMLSMNLSLGESSIILASTVGSDEYPINSLRNLAIEHAKTPFLLLLDADFQPSPGLAKNFDAAYRTIFRNLSSSSSSSQQTDGRKIGNTLLDAFADNASRIAFVVPAFGYLEMPKKEDPIVGSKEELLELIHREEAIIEPFRLHESSDAHKLTNYWHWYHSTEPYDIVAKFHDKYEPYIIVRKTDQLPRYSETFTNYGMNKVMHITELFAAKYRFTVLHNVWTIHSPHRSSRYYQDFMQNLEQRLVNRAQRFKILERIIRQYNITLNDCSTIKF